MNSVSTCADAYQPIESERLLGIQDVAAYLGITPITASRVMKRSGHALELCRRVYIKESAFRTYLQELEGATCL